jgi:hypothetical protein
MIVKAQQSELQTELDKVLADQLYSARRRLKAINRFLKLMPNEPWLIKGKKRCEMNIEWYESLINDKKLKKKRRINIVRTLSNVKYYVRFIRFFTIKRKK